MLQAAAEESLDDIQQPPFSLKGRVYVTARSDHCHDLRSYRSQHGRGRRTRHRYRRPIRRNDTDGERDARGHTGYDKSEDNDNDPAKQ